VLFNLARCYEKLQETARALRFYRDYLHQSPDAKDRGLVLDSIAALEARLRKRGVSQLIVYTEPPGARVQVNGKDIGESPASVELVPGVHPLVVSAEGYVTETQYVTVRFDKLPEAVISLVRSPEAEPPRERAPVNPRPAAPRPPAPAEALPQAAVAIEAGEQAEETHVQVAPWIAAGGAVAGVAVGAGFGWKASDTANTYRTTTQFDRRPALKAEIESQALVANGAFIVAGAAAVTAVVLLLVSR